MSHNPLAQAVQATPLRGAIPEVYRELVPPELRNLLQQLPPHMLALGTGYEGRALGLAVAELGAKPGTARLQTVTIAEPVRRQGLGRQLYDLLESGLRQNGVRSVSAEFLAGEEAASNEASFLQACGFAQPEPGIHVRHVPLRVASVLPWTAARPLPKAFGVDTFASLTPEERRAMQQGLGSWYPPLLSPFLEEKLIDPERSLLLRYQGGVAGWMILERFDPETILFKTMFVHRRHQRMARGIALIAEALRRLKSNPGGYRNAIFTVGADNADMVRFMNKHIAHPAIQAEVLWRTVKPL